MSRHLLSEYASIKAYSSIGVFANLDTVAINVYKNGSLEPLDSAVCLEISATGIFTWSFANLTAAPDDLSEYYWVMSDITTKKESSKEIVYFGGYPELLLSLPQALDPANICRITTQLYEADGSCIVDPNTFADQSINENSIELKTSFNDGTRYFKLGKFAPSYDESTGAAFWLVPRLSTVDVKLTSFGVTKTSALVPDQSTIDLKTWLDSI